MVFSLSDLIVVIVIISFAGLAVMLTLYPKDLQIALRAFANWREKSRQPSVGGSLPASYPIHPYFLKDDARQTLITMARDERPENRAAAIWARAVVLLDDGMTLVQVSSLLNQPTETIIAWYRIFQDNGIQGLNR
jgi:hypothetical protein